MQSSLLTVILLTGVLIALPHIALSKSDQEICEDCKAFMTDVSKMLRNETDQEIIVKKVEGMCHIFGSEYCAELVDEYGPIALSYLSDYFVPGSVCSGLDLCPRKKRMSGAEHHQLNKPPVRDNGNSCADCITFLGDLSDMLHNKTNQNIIRGKLHQICNLLGIDCSDFKIDIALIWLQNLLPRSICKKMSFCPKQSEFSEKEHLSSKNQNPSLL
ncbi:prosaposin-like [Patiria miniata]|uniref:Saposin B-type domain-containing protein n=1 Tax=Patiria miniata TaxID=46514 RepID=A0A914A9Y8_PATMI|nr:prosaposin-like [Patiria miniata]XP_038060579.1 prosaposin-like [Patiria miniata]